MKTKIYVATVVVATFFFVAGRITARSGATLGQKTQDNLATAMRGEAFAFAKYMLYAKQAEQNGNKELAKTFETAAHIERFQHFAEEAELAGLVGSDADNLRDAIKGESYEVENMYFEFAHQAATAGDKEAAERFEEVRHDEMGHRDAFKAALAKMDAPAGGSQ